MLKEKINQFYLKTISSSKKITVIGDFLIDEYFFGEINKINPEFPSAIIKLASEIPQKILPGGAGNVIKQLENFKCEANIISILDEYASDLLDKNSIVKTFSYIGNDIFVPRKKRFFSNDFFIHRTDIEQNNYGKNSLDEILSNLTIPESDVVIYSDYDKGIFKRPWFRQQMYNHISIVDPKANIDKWHGCTIFKPNSKEAYDLSGKKEWKDQLTFFMKTLECKGVLITQSGEGVVGCWENVDECFEIRPTKLPSFVESVIGAGDSFISIVALCIAHGFDLKTAAEIGFLGGLCYVQRKHNQPNSWIDLYQSCEDYDKIFDYPEVLKSKNNKIVFTNGCFDILHPGHIETLKFAKSKGDKLVVAINSDESVKKLKGSSRPINSLADRMKVISSLECVDYVVSFNEDNPCDLLTKIQPDVLIKGGDYKEKEAVGHELVKEVYISKLINGHSTTSIIEKTKNV